MSITATPEIVERTIAAFIGELGVEPDKISRDASFAELDLDSLDVIELAQVIEDKHGVALAAQDLKTIRTVGEAADLVVSRLG